MATQEALIEERLLAPEPSPEPMPVASVSSRLAVTATMVDEGPFFTDGPFTETKEFLLGR
jgi:hypothetical protein